MGYRSDIAIAVHKTIIARDLIDPIIPDVLKKEPFQDIKEADTGYFLGGNFMIHIQKCKTFKISLMR